MKNHILFSAALLALGSTQDIACKSGVHIIVARATTELPGIGILSGVVNNITKMVPESDAVPVPYPASFTSPIYPDSVREGVGNMTKLIKEYGDACPDSRMVLMGYSQGAHVTGDVLAGSDSNFTSGEVTPPLDEKYRNQIAAIILMGDPTFQKNQSFDFGNATNKSFFPRSNTAELYSLGLASKMRSYCTSGDYYCDSGNGTKSRTIHASYTFNDGANAMDFVVEKVNAFAVNSTANGTTTDGGDATTTTGTAGSATATAQQGNDASRSGFVSYLMSAVLGSAVVVAVML